ncbi:MAG: protein of unknown function DUF6 transmembrane [Parcubacteria bacterium C7867-004]|nr:MAG: protein of unknown function DUF6 transmembrane [Parcubacteria bacterium C7867-004]
MWFALAIAASLFWGLTYAINEQLYRHISISTYLAVGSLIGTILFFLIAVFSGSLSKDIATFASSPRALFLLVGSVLAFVCAELLIAYSITGKNAVLAGLVEISYPIFIVLFGYMLFKESSLTVATIAGGALIFMGVATIYVFNR